MLGFVARRLLISIPVLFAASILVFIMVANSGDPLGDLHSRPNVPRAVIEARRHELHLDRPVVVRYGIWAGHFLKGDFGKSIGGRDVRSDLWRRMKVTLRMVLLSVVVAVVLAVAVGVFSAVRQYSMGDYAATFLGFLFLSTPVFWLAAVLKFRVAIPLNERLGHTVLYTVGEETPNLAGSYVSRLWNQLGHLALPTVSLALISFAAWSRFQRSSMLDVLNSDYVRLAKAKGLPRWEVMVKHALRNALIPIVTVVSLDFAAILGGAVVTERVFGWQGMGSMIVDGVNNVDVNVVLAWLMVTAVVVVLFNLVTDIVYGIIDPRIRYG